MKSLIIIPTYNEKENIASIVREVLAITAQHLEKHPVELLIVDDGSPDGTGQIADQIAQSEKRLHVLHRKGKLGLGSAYVAGFQWGLEKGFEACIEMDADFSHRPAYLEPMLENLEKFDFVIGSRYVSGGGTKNWGLIRKIISRGGSFYSRVILGAPIHDFTGGFNGWRAEVLRAISLDTIRSDGYSFQIELKYRAYQKGFRFVEFPILFEDRKVGHSKMSRKIVFEALRKVWSFRFGNS